MCEICCTRLIIAPAHLYCPHVAGKHFIQLEVTMKTHVKKDLDKDWHMLMQEARSIGLGIRDVRQFLESETALRKNNHKKTVRQD
jgi:anti-repressor of SlrR